MGVRNYLIEGVSCTGKPTDTASHENHIWDVEKVKALVDNKNEPVTFFCGGSRNFSTFIDLFDGVFVLEVDRETLNQRLDERPDNEFGGKKSERELIAHLHQTKEDIPENGIIIDATEPIGHVVDAVIREVEGV
ncbi:nucleoside kinase [Rossellomorea sp. YZS02]|uniref:nucleoside kinase n=1 Tax=Rossellomorea sp. YZS02 TaxID=3097358 RepID=UPI002A0E34EA|nr:nucleoside kinase [Rossellomorea sp. YZS02]MDX8342246.1 nucleoside kinase [Rossellomorea sp. YZS02]